MDSCNFLFQTVQITRKFTSLHNAYADRILKEFQDPRHPVINPIWWIDPEDKIALVTSSGKKLILTFSIFKTEII